MRVAAICLAGLLVAPSSAKALDWAKDFPLVHNELRSSDFGRCEAIRNIDGDSSDDLNCKFEVLTGHTGSVDSIFLTVTHSRYGNWVDGISMAFHPLTAIRNPDIVAKYRSIAHFPYKSGTLVDQFATPNDFATYCLNRGDRRVPHACGVNETDDLAAGIFIQLDGLYDPEKVLLQVIVDTGRGRRCVRDRECAKARR